MDFLACNLFCQTQLWKGLRELKIRDVYSNVRFCTGFVSYF